MLKTILIRLLRPILMLLSAVLMISGLLMLPENTSYENRIHGDQTGKMKVWFFDVGQADAALIIADGEAMLIDGGNAADSSLIVSALRKIGVSHLRVLICTHAHEDHVGGLSGALNACTADTVYAPVTEYDSKSFSDFKFFAKKRGCALTVPKQGDSFSLGGATVRFLSPVPVAETVNDTSLVVHVSYGAHSFLFAGDAERSAELQLLDAGVICQATVLKVGHHGSDSSTSYPFLREVSPRYAVISVEKGNSYGFPDEVVLSRLADADCTVFRTDLCGEILFETDGKTLTVSTERPYQAEAALQTQSTEKIIPADAAYVGNRKSMKFHKTDCRFLPSEHNREYFAARAPAIEAGYLPCGQCKP